MSYYWYYERGSTEYYLYYFDDADPSYDSVVSSLGFKLAVGIGTVSVLAICAAVIAVFCIRLKAKQDKEAAAAAAAAAHQNAIQMNGMSFQPQPVAVYDAVVENMGNHISSSVLKLIPAECLDTRDAQIIGAGGSGQIYLSQVSVRMTWHSVEGFLTSLQIYFKHSHHSCFSVQLLTDLMEPISDGRPQARIIAPRGTQVALKETFAMKMFARSMTENHYQEFLNELTLLQTLFHENIVPFYGLFCDQGQGLTSHGRAATNRYFLVTKYADNGSLANFVERSFEEISFGLRCSWTLQIAAAIEYVLFFWPTVGCS